MVDELCYTDKKIFATTSCRDMLEYIPRQAKSTCEQDYRYDWHSNEVINTLEIEMVSTRGNFWFAPWAVDCVDKQSRFKSSL